MDSSKGSKPRKGIRKLMDKLTVSRSQSRSRSPSQSSHQLDPRALTAAVALGEDAGSTSNVTGFPAGSIGGGLEIPTVVEPVRENTAFIQRDTERENQPPGTSAPGTTVSPFEPSKPDKQTGNVAWTALRTSLRFLHESSSIFPTLSSAIGVLLKCIDGLEAAAKHREDYEQLATTLADMSDSLKLYTNSMSLTHSMSSLALSLEREARGIQERLGQTNAGGFRDASTGEEELLGHYRRVQSLFQQLQINASMSTWSIVNEQLANSRLEGLNPVKQATYDSNLSTEVSRRGCTEGTRTAVLAGLDNWLLDPTSASIYWMNGMAGTGKTTIAYSFCEQVDKRKQLAASFFCTRNAVDCRKTSQIVPTIAYQLARYSIPYQSALCEVLGQNPDIASKHVQKQFEQLLKDPLQQVKASMPDELVVVIDALDECEDRRGVERTLDMLLQYAQQVPLKFLITSRPEPEIYNRMQLHAQSRAVIHLHDIETSLVRADIELYLNEELSFMSSSRTEIDQLAHRSGCLFIYAATLVRYILYGKRVANPRQRLQSVLSLTPQSSKKHAEIDALYTAILESALQEAQMEDHEAEDVKTVLRTVLFSQEPIGVETIAVLGGLDDSERVLYALQPLRSVIHQSEQTGLVSTLHASFPDFLLSYTRSGEFFCDVAQHSQLLARRCFSTMKSELRFNICALESSFVPDEQVTDLEARIKSNITPTLAYACQYWATHLGMATRSGALLRMLNELLSHRLLFWMEVLNLNLMMSTGIDMLQKANIWINQIGSPVSEESFIRLAEDSYTFVTNFAGSAASQSTPHIYISCLPFCSRSNQVYKHYWKRTQGLLELKGSLIDKRSSAAIASWQDEKFTAHAFSSDGSRCLGGLGDAVMIRNVYNGATVVGPMVGHTDKVTACCFSVDESRVFSASKDGSLRVWDAYSGVLVFGPVKYDTSHIRSLGLVGDLPDPVPVPFKSDTNYIKSIAWSADGTRIAACFRRASTIYLWDANTGTLIRVLNDHAYNVNMVAMSPGGTLFASVSNDIRLWNVRDGTPATRLYQGHKPVYRSCVTFTPDGTRVISAGNDIQLWRISDGLAIAKFAPNLNISSLALTLDGTQLASGSDNRTIRLWDVNDGTLLAGPFSASNSLAPNLFNLVTPLKYTPEGTRLLARTSDGTITVWPVQEILSKSFSPAASTTSLNLTRSLMFSDDGKHILTQDQTYYKTAGARSWDVHDGSFTEVSDKGYPFLGEYARSLLSPNGQYTVTVTLGNDEKKQVINTSDKSVVLGPWPLHIMSASMAAQFSQDSRTIVVGSPDGTTSLWDLESRQIIAGPFPGDVPVAEHVALSPDSSLIASWSSYGLRIYNTYTPVFDIPVPANPKLGSPSNSHQMDVYEGWNMQEDGWVTNSSSHLLFCSPLEFRRAWPSAHTSLIVTSRGTVQVPKQMLFLGELWHRCYTSDNK